MVRSKRFWLGILLLAAGLLALHRAHRGVIILHYHGINYAQGPEKLISIEPEDFAWQMQYLQTAGYSVVTLEQAVDYLSKGRRLPPKAVAITFDDGYADNYEQALPILKKHNYPATIFVVTGEIGGTNSWDQDIGFAKLELLSWEQIDELAKNQVSVMPHTVHHLNLTKLSKADAARELAESKAVLEERLALPPAYFAYPYGSLNQAVVDLVKDAGFTAAFTSSPGTNIPSKTDIYRIRRLPVKKDHRGFWGRLLFVWELKLSSLFPR